MEKRLTLHKTQAVSKSKVITEISLKLLSMLKSKVIYIMFAQLRTITAKTLF